MKKLCLTLFMSSLVSCASIPDFITCKELSVSRAACIKVVSEEKFFWDEQNKVNGKTYFEIRPTLIQIPPDSYADLKAFILKSCKRYGNCAELDGKIKAIDENLKEF